MKGVAGWFSARPRPDGDAVLHAMLGALPVAPTGLVVRTEPSCGLAAYGDAAPSRLVDSGGVRLAIVGHPRWRGKSGGDRDRDLVEAVRAQGADALTDIGGDFAIAAWDDARERGFIAVDRIGVHQLVYGRFDDSLVFASTLDALIGHPAARRELSPQGIFDYLYYHVVPGPETVYAGLLRLAAGHCIEFGAGSASEPRRYWELRFVEEPGRSFESWKDEFRTVIRRSVADAADDDATGAFLSGGTDSSTVSGLLGGLGRGPARTFSIGFDVEGYDEMSYARIAAEHFRCDHHEYYVTPDDVVQAVPRIAAFYDQPFGNASAIPTYHCARLAREHGVVRLLAGDGGDELFGGNERYAKQHVLGLYQRVPAVLRRRVLEPLLLSAPADTRWTLLRKGRSYVEQARPPMPDRYASYNLLTYLGHRRVLASDFLSTVDTDRPQRLLVEAHAPFADASLINQMLGIDLRFTLADGDLPKVTRMCELAGADVAFPLLDERVVEFSARLPASMKLRGTTLRWFFKEALRDFLPAAIIAKHKHGFGLPVGAWLVGHRPLYDLAVDSIALVGDRGIVDKRFVDELLHRRLREHPAYFGTMVWLLMMLGIWLDSRRL